MITVADLRLRLGDAYDSAMICVDGSGPLTEVILEMGANEPFVLLKHPTDVPRWQPVATAPRDGTWILGYSPLMSITDYPMVIFWDDNGWVTPHGEPGVHITHWYPMIRPPDYGNMLSSHRTHDWDRTGQCTRCMVIKGEPGDDLCPL